MQTNYKTLIPPQLWEIMRDELDYGEQYLSANFQVIDIPQPIRYGWLEWEAKLRIAEKFNIQT